MIWPLMAGGLTFWDATLESVSALTTTGLSTVEDIEHRMPAFVFARAWMQWYGGLVIVVLALGLVIEPGPAAKRLFGAETEGAGLIGGTRARVRRALVVYSALLVFGISLLIALGVGPFDALVHSLAAVSTGGFSSRDASIAGLGGPAVQIAVTVLCFCGAISLYPSKWRGGWKQLFADAELRAILLSVCLVTIILYLSLVLVDGRPWSDSIRAAPLLAFSAQTTSGFEAVRVAELGAASKVTLILSMFIGGDMGSTAGGIKIVRFLLVLRLVQLLLRRTCLPQHAVLELDGSDDRFQVREIMAMLAVIFLFIVAIIASWLTFLFFGFSSLDSLFEVVSALGTVGLSAGLTSSALPPLLKAVLCVDMLMGRVEVVAIVILLYPRTWLGRRAEVV
jgi:trk system potassium uptake protein TrkH